MGIHDPEDEQATFKQATRIGSVSETAYDLEVVEGPDRGARITIDVESPSRVLVGQGPACDLKLTDRSVSRRHASLELTERGLRLTDLGSTNGTLVGPLPVVQLYLQGDTLVAFGSTKVRITARRIAARPSAQGAAPDRFGRVIGASTAMRQIHALAERLASSDLPIIIEGETGTGKEILAESIHERGPRAASPFVVFDCTAASFHGVEAELFGLEDPARGVVKKGLFEQARGGTLLIDEIGDLDISLQPKLLGAIARSELRRVGGSETIGIDVRIIATTRRDLDREVLAGRFRDDLFHRLAVARIELPPLRCRRGDIALLARHFCDELGADEDTSEERVLRHLRKWDDDPWPGNVRELRNAVSRQLALGDLSFAEDRSSTAREGEARDREEADVIARILAEKLPFGRARARILDAFRTRYVEWALAEHGGNVARAAAASGIGRRYFQRIKSKPPAR